MPKKIQLLESDRVQLKRKLGWLIDGELENCMFAQCEIIFSCPWLQKVEFNGKIINLLCLNCSYLWYSEHNCSVSRWSSCFVNTKPVQVSNFRFRWIFNAWRTGLQSCIIIIDIINWGGRGRETTNRKGRGREGSARTRSKCRASLKIVAIIPILKIADV